jgi:hypothetical protein
MRAKNYSPRKVEKMSISTPTLESFKEKAKTVRQFLNDKYNVNVSRGHGLEIVSKIFGFDGWKAASAAIKPKEKLSVSAKIETIQDLKLALEAFDESDLVEASYGFKLFDFLDELEEDDSEDDEIIQGFSFALKPITEGIVGIELHLETEDMIRNYEGTRLNYRTLR